MRDKNIDSVPDLFISLAFFMCLSPHLCHDFSFHTLKMSVFYLNPMSFCPCLCRDRTSLFQSGPGGPGGVVARLVEMKLRESLQKLGFPPVLCDWIIKGLGMSSRVCATGR